jgi:hypothetical protein
MIRFRLSTLMLLIVIAALVAGLAVQERRHRRIEAEQEALINTHRMTIEMNGNQYTMKLNEMQYRLDRMAGGAGGAGDGK